MSDGTIRITYVKSADRYSADQAQTIRSLGFTRLNQTIEKADTPDIRGMVRKIGHLVVVENEDSSNGASDA